MSWVLPESFLLAGLDSGGNQPKGQFFWSQRLIELLFASDIKDIPLASSVLYDAWPIAHWEGYCSLNNFIVKSHNFVFISHWYTRVPSPFKKGDYRSKLYFAYKLKNIYWLGFFLEKKEGRRERETERERDQFVVPLTYAFIHCFLSVPYLEIKPATVLYWADTLTTGISSQGLPTKFSAFRTACSNLDVGTSQALLDGWSLAVFFLFSWL